jgi:hypothetical protein
VEDLGPPIAHLALEEGTPVYDRSGERLGVVDRVVTDRDGDIFEGVIIHTLPLPGRHLYANHDQIAELRERGVLLSVHRDALHELSSPSETRLRPECRGYGPSSPTQGVGLDHGLALSRRSHSVDGPGAGPIAHSRSPPLECDTRMRGQVL